MTRAAPFPSMMENITRCVIDVKQNDAERQGDGWGRAGKGSGTRGVAVDGEGMVLRRPPLPDEAHPQQDPENEGDGEYEPCQLQGGQDDPYQVKPALLAPHPGHCCHPPRHSLPLLAPSI